MKKFRKGFTLLELLVVIGVMGILSSTAMIAGQQTTNAARATNIADNLEKIASAMMMYYSDNADNIAVNGIVDEAAAGKITAADLLAGTQAYLKTATDVVSGTPAEGKYGIVLNGTAPAQTWWIVYTIPANDVGGVGPILKNKNNRMGLKKATTGAENTEYDGGATLAMQVR